MHLPTAFEMRGRKEVLPDVPLGGPLPETLVDGGLGDLQGPAIETVLDPSLATQGPFVLVRRG